VDHSIRKLLHGFRVFQQDYFANNQNLYHKLRTGQHPKVLVIACSDSRVDPALLTNCEPGDIFVIRNIANLVPPYEPGSGMHHGVSSALEYAVRNLQVEHIIILGHSDCGGIKTLLEPDSLNYSDDFIGSWLSLAAPARDAVIHDKDLTSLPQRCQACEEASILLSLENLLSFPWIAQKVANRTLSLHGWYFNLAQGELYSYVPAEKSFISLRNSPI